MASSGLVFMVLLFSMAAHSSDATWCICKEGISETALQKTLDYACGAGADCNPTHQNGPCFNPNTVRAHCNYAVNSYFQRNRQVATACDFSATATIITSDPSAAGCMYPATASATTTSPVNTRPMTPGTTTTVPNGGSGTPLVTTPSGVLGGTNNGLSPSGMYNNDISVGGALLQTSIILSISSIILTFSSLVLW